MYKKNIFISLENVVHRAWTIHIPKASIRESNEWNKHSQAKSKLTCILIWSSPLNPFHYCLLDQTKSFQLYFTNKNHILPEASYTRTSSSIAASIKRNRELHRVATGKWP